MPPPPYYFDYSNQDPAMNLALDEAMLDYANELSPKPMLRTWESSQDFIVLGYSSHVKDDVEWEPASQDGIPVLRRASGGGTVLQGPGCLNYAYVGEPLDPIGIEKSSEMVLTHLLEALRPLSPQIAGLSDVVVNAKKVVGNAARRRKNAFLYHGSILYQFDLEKMSRYLKLPPKRPAYREDRSHRDFVANLPFSAVDLRRRLAEAFSAHTLLPQNIQAELLRRAKEKIRLNSEKTR